MSLTALKLIDRVSLVERRSFPIVSRFSQFRVELVKCTQCWVTSYSVAQRLSPPMTRFSVSNYSSFMFSVGTRCRRFLRRHVVGVCRIYERGVPARALYPLYLRIASKQSRKCATYSTVSIVVCRVLVFSWRGRCCFD